MSIDISVIWFVIIVFATLMYIYRDGWFRFRYWDAVQRGA